MSIDDWIAQGGILLSTESVEMREAIDAYQVQMLPPDEVIRLACAIFMQSMGENVYVRQSIKGKK